MANVSEPADTLSVSRSELRVFQNRRRGMIALLTLLCVPAILVTAPLVSRASLGGMVIFALSLVCLSLAVLIRTWASIYVGGRKGRELVTSGPYSLVRNPLYVGSFFGSFGVGLGFGSFTLGLLLTVLSYLVFDWLVKREEARLREEFTPAVFDAYTSAVHRWIPAMKPLPPVERMNVDGATVMRTLLQALLFFAGLALAYGLELARAAGWIAPLIQLP